MVARLTPDQKVACSIHVGFNTRHRLCASKTKPVPTLHQLLSGLSIQVFLCGKFSFLY
ncbi:hypothetical protein GBA52_000806 [Prunus armeniaca]|nr:hypothetical protein GBA52_000806 [Prunus armeniaca]